MDNTLEKAILQIITEKCENNWDFDQPMTRGEFVEILKRAIEIRDNR